MVKSVTDLEPIAQTLVGLLPNHPIALFYGPMGAGKTTLIKAVCQALQVTDNVSSPTYSLVNEYKTATAQTVYHFDFYRMNSVEEAIDIGALEYFDSQNPCLIEWPQMVENLLPPNQIIVNIDIDTTNNHRTLSIYTLWKKVKKVA